MTDTQHEQPALPFGKHKDRPLAEIPAGYLEWAVRALKLSSGLRAAVAGELAARGLRAPDPPPFTVPPCPRDCAAGYSCHWLEDSLGRRRVRAECPACGLCLAHPPCRPPFSTAADAAASPTAILDVLTQLEALGVELQSDGRVVFLGNDYARVPLDLRAKLRQCRHRLAGLLGKRRPPCRGAA